MPTRLFGISLWYTKTETEINRIFANHRTTLEENRFKVTGEIIKWREKLISQIEEHTRAENERLEEKYQERIRHLEDEQQQALTRVSEYETRKDDAQLKTFLHECDQLKLQLFKLGSFEQSIRVVLESEEESASVQWATANESLQELEEPITVDDPNKVPVAGGSGRDSLDGSSPSGEAATP